MIKGARCQPDASREPSGTLQIDQGHGPCARQDYDAIEYCGSSQSTLEELAKYANVPVYNGFTDESIQSGAGRFPHDAGKS